MSYPVALLVVGPLLIFSPAFVCALVAYFIIKKEEKMSKMSDLALFKDDLVNDIQTVADKLNACAMQLCSVCEFDKEHDEGGIDFCREKFIKSMASKCRDIAEREEEDGNGNNSI